MSRRIWISILTLLIAFCLGLSLITAVGAVVISRENKAAPAQIIPAP